MPNWSRPADCLTAILLPPYSFSYSSSVTGSHHSFRQPSPGTSTAIWLNQLSFFAPCQCFTSAGIITTLHGAIVVVYTGNTNPIYQLGQKDAQLGLAALAQRGDPGQLKASLEKVPQVRKIYTITKTALPGESMECTYEAAANEKVAFATMFGYSNDWFFANGPELNALTKGDITSKTVLLDDGTAVSQYPGAGNAQSVFGGTLMPEDKAISAVGDTYPVPAVDGIVKITIY